MGPSYRAFLSIQPLGSNRVTLRWNIRAGGTTAGRVWLGFGTMALLLVLLSAALIAGESTSATSTQILIVSGVVAAFLTAFLLGRGIVQGEKKLYASREHWRVTLASIGDAVITTDIDGRVVYLNAVAEQLTGWSSAEASGQSLEAVFRIVSESTRETVANPASRALQEGVVVALANHTLLIARDGSETPIDDSAAPIRDEQGAISGVVLIFRDVTERRRVEDSLSRSRDELEHRVDERTAELARANAFMHTLLENLQEGIVACDAEGVLTLFNKATRDFHGLPQEPVPAERWADHYNLYLADGHTPMRTEDVPLFRALRGEQVRGAEMVIAPANGSPRSLLAYAKALHDADGKVQGAVVSMHDITRRKQAEADLQEAHAELESRVAERTMDLGKANDALRREIGVRSQAEEQLRQSETRKSAMFEAALDCIVSTDHEDRIIEFNAAAERTFGHRREDVLGRDMAELIIPPAYRARHRAGMARYLATGEGPVMDKRLELSALHAEGHEFPVELTVTRIPVPGTPVFTAYLRDISDRKRAEAALRESDLRWAGIFEQLHEGFIIGEIVHDAAGNAVDWRYLELNGAWEAMTGLPRESVQGSLLSEVIPGTEPEWVQDFAEVVRTGEPATFLREVAVLGRWYEVHAFRPEPGRFAAFSSISASAIALKKCASKASSACASSWTRCRRRSSPPSRTATSITSIRSGWSSPGFRSSRSATGAGSSSSIPTMSTKTSGSGSTRWRRVNRSSSSTASAMSAASIDGTLAAPCRCRTTPATS